MVLATVAFTLCTIAMTFSWAGAKSAATDEHYRRLEESLQRELEGRNRRTGIDYPTSTDQSFQYDVEGRMTQAVDGTGTRTYTYDALGRKTYQTDPRGNTTATYDAPSRLLSQTDVTNRLIEYDYDPNGRMELVEDPTSWATYEYDPRGRMTKETFSNGVYSQYGYDNASRLTSLTHKKTVDNSLILGYAATYDAASRLTQAVESPTTATTP
jgi:YD repeat-containing protein